MFTLLKVRESRMATGLGCVFGCAGCQRQPSIITSDSRLPTRCLCPRLWCLDRRIRDVVVGDVLRFRHLLSPKGLKVRRIQRWSIF